MIDRVRGGDDVVAKVATGSYFEDMKVVGIKVLKNKLSEYVKLAAAGERILVTDRDEVVAELVAPRKDPDPNMDDPWWAEQVRRGIITPATDTSWRPPQHDRPPLPGPSILETLEEMRKDSWEP